MLVWVQVGVCFHNYWNGVAQTFGNKQGRVSKFDAKGSVAVSQIMYANIRQGGDSGAAGQLLVERCARHVEHAVVRGQPIEPGAVGAELFGQPVRNRNIAHKPNILIPLSRNASRGDQILNANSFQKQGFSYVIEEEELTDQTLSEAIQTVWTKRADYIHAMESSDQMDAVTTITNLIEKLRKH